MKSKSRSLNLELIFRALADLTRLRILQLLQGGEQCVCDLVAALDVPQPTASRHLAYLRKAGLVQCRKVGHWCYYQLAPAANTFHAKLLDCLACCAGELAQCCRGKSSSSRCCE
jgi:ArsR family transcriptional regulator